MTMDQWGRRSEQLIPQVADDADYEFLAQRALEQWQNAIQYYNSVSDPELVDYAAFEIEASRRKYEYMVRKLRRNNNIHIQIE